MALEPCLKIICDVCSAVIESDDENELVARFQEHISREHSMVFDEELARKLVSERIFIVYEGQPPPSPGSH